MGYRVTVTTPVTAGLAGAAIGVGGTFAVCPDRLKWLVCAAQLAIWVGIAFLLARVSFNNNELIFADDALILPKRTIRAHDVRSIVLQERWDVFTIYFQRRGQVWTISFRRQDREQVRSALRQWAWQNHVVLHSPGRRTQRP